MPKLIFNHISKGLLDSGPDTIFWYKGQFQPALVSEVLYESGLTYLQIATFMNNFYSTKHFTGDKVRAHLYNYYPNYKPHYLPTELWPAASIQLLTNLWSTTMPASKIAKQLAAQFPPQQFTKSSVVGMISRLRKAGADLPKRPRRGNVAKGPRRVKNRGYYAKTPLQPSKPLP